MKWFPLVVLLAGCLTTPTPDAPTPPSDDVASPVDVLHLDALGGRLTGNQTAEMLIAFNSTLTADDITMRGPAPFAVAPTGIALVPVEPCMPGIVWLFVGDGGSSDVILLGNAVPAGVYRAILFAPEGFDVAFEFTLENSRGTRDFPVTGASNASAQLAWHDMSLDAATQTRSFESSGSGPGALGVVVGRTSGAAGTITAEISDDVTCAESSTSTSPEPTRIWRGSAGTAASGMEWTGRAAYTGPDAAADVRGVVVYVVD